MSDNLAYELPDGVIGLKGPIQKPAPGSLPLRGDLAHIALAHRYLAAHYVVPEPRTIGPDGATFLLQPRDSADAGASLAGGASVELLDIAGDWAWACCGPEGPSGYIPLSAFAD